MAIDLGVVGPLQVGFQQQNLSLPVAQAARGGYGA